MISLLKWTFLLLVSLLLILFITVNRHEVTLNLFPLPYEAAMPAYVFIALFFILGYFVASMLALFSRLGARWQLSKARRTISAQENELKGLRMESTQRQTFPEALEKQ